MDLILNNKVVLVTGGANGIGAAIAVACGQEGAIPVIFDHDQVAIQELTLALNKKGIVNEAVFVELTKSSGISPHVEAIGKKFGHIDGLVNNAGVNDGVGLEHGSPDRFFASLEQNLVHYYSMAQAALPFLKQSKGCIVNIGSKVAVTGQGGTSGYAASKGAILGLTHEWAIELLASGVRVNVVVPAEVLTPQYLRWVQQFSDPDEKLRSVASRVPFSRRMTSVDEIAAMVVFLLSPRSTGITGQEVFVDGGYVHLDRSL